MKLSAKLSLLIVVLVFSTAIVLVLSPHSAESVGNLQNAKITLSDSRPGENAEHTYYFKTTTAIPASGKIIIDLDAENLGASAPFDISSIDVNDITLAWSAGDDPNMGTTNPCTLGTGPSYGQVGVGISNPIITFTLADDGTCAGIGSTAYVQATVGTIGSHDIANPGKVASAGIADTYLVSYETQDHEDVTLDTATVRAAIIDAVTITAEVKATLDCAVEGVNVGTSFNAPANDYGTAGFDTTATTIPFGVLNSGSANASQSGQLLKAGTNGTNGFYFAVKQHGNLTSSGGDDIDVFKDGVQVGNSSPEEWASPTGTGGEENTYGHLGYGTTDLTLDFLGGGNDNRFGGAKFAGLSTTYEAVLSHDGACTSSDTTNGQGYVVYKVEISGLQEAGVYSGTVSYLCTGRY